MAQQCPECGAGVDDAPWCGACGARLDHATDEPTPSRRRGPWTALGVVVVAVAVAVVVGVVGPGGPDRGAADGAAGDATAVEGATVVPPVLPSPGPAVGRQFAATVTTLWERADMPPAARHATVVPAGERHVLVGDRLVTTDPGAAEPADAGLRVLPEPIRSSAIAPDGAWAVAELGRLVIGHTGGSGTTSTEVGGGWAPTGAAVAWRGGEPVLHGTDDHLARVRADGTVRWRTAAPVLPEGPPGDRWVTGRRDDGTPVAISLDDGRLVPVEAVPVALHGDVAVIVAADVVARDLTTGQELWRRPDDGATWQAVGDALVAVAADGAIRVDPHSGVERGRVTGAGLVPTADGAVVAAAGLVRAVGWDGVPMWTVALDAGGAHDLTALDGRRVAVTSGTRLDSRVTILGAEDGAVLAALAAPVVIDCGLVGDGEVVTVLTSDGPGVTVDAATGTDVDATPNSTRPDDLSFAASGGPVVVTAGATTLRGTTAGAEVWTLVLEAPLAGPPVRSGPTLVVGLVDGTVAALDPLRGESRWQQDLDALPTAVAGDGTVLLVGTGDGRVLRLDPNGRTVTSADLGTGPVLGLVAGRPAAALLGDRLVGFDVAG